MVEEFSSKMILRKIYFMDFLSFYDIVLLSSIDVERKKLVIFSSWTFSTAYVYGYDVCLEVAFNGVFCICKVDIYIIFFGATYICCYPYMCMRYPSFFITHGYLLFILYWYLSIGKLFLMIVTPSDR